MQEKIIKKQIDLGNIKFYHRYIDDIIVVLAKNKKSEFCREINDFDENLEFTEETLGEAGLNFLDKTLYYNEKKYSRN